MKALILMLHRVVFSAYVTLGAFLLVESLRLGMYTQFVGAIVITMIAGWMLAVTMNEEKTL